MDAARGAVRLCLDTFAICAVDRLSLEQAIYLPGGDFEDNLQVVCATLAGLDAIITRDKDGFQGSTITVLTPTELLAQLNLTEE